MKRLFLHLLLLICLATLLGCSSSNRTNDNANTKAISNARNRTNQSLGPQQTLSAFVVSVLDGDTVAVMDEQNRSEKIRLQGIDAPEKEQAFGQASRRNLAALIAGKSVIIEWSKRDLHDRIVGKILFDGRDICLEQVRAGLAWHYKQFENEQTEDDRRLYDQAEQQARSQGLGLWQDTSPTPPWDFRHNRPGNDKADQANGTGATTPNDETSGTILGNKRTMIYHWPGCPYYDQISPHNRVRFQSREDAEKAGYRAARNCP